MGKYDKLSEAELFEAWGAGKPGPQTPVLKALAAKGTTTAAEFIDGCIFKQSTGRAAKSVIAQLAAVGDASAPFIAGLIAQPDAVQDARPDEWMQLLRDLGDAGIAACRAELQTCIEAYRTSFAALDEELLSAPEDLRPVARKRVLAGFSGGSDAEAALTEAKALQALWAPHLDPAWVNWTAAWQTRNRVLSNLAIAIETLGSLAGETFEPRQVSEGGSLVLASV